MMNLCCEIGKKVKVGMGWSIRIQQRKKEFRVPVGPERSEVGAKKKHWKGSKEC